MAVNFPDPPESTLWIDMLHWCVRVMDTSDPDLAFTASLLSHALKNGWLTDKQGKYAQRIYDRVAFRYERGQLPAQGDDLASLATSPIAGHA